MYKQTIIYHNFNMVMVNNGIKQPSSTMKQHTVQCAFNIKLYIFISYINIQYVPTPFMTNNNND